MCSKNLGDENWEGNASHGVFGLSSLQDDVIDDRREINFRPLNDVVNEVGLLNGEIILVGSWN